MEQVGFPVAQISFWSMEAPDAGKKIAQTMPVTKFCAQDVFGLTVKHLIYIKSVLLAKEKEL